MKSSKLKFCSVRTSIRPEKGTCFAHCAINVVPVTFISSSIRPPKLDLKLISNVIILIKYLRLNLIIIWQDDFLLLNSFPSSLDLCLWLLLCEFFFHFFFQYFLETLLVIATEWLHLSFFSDEVLIHF